MRRHIADAGLSASVHDVTGGTAQLNLQGPDARALLAEPSRVASLSGFERLVLG